MYSKNTILHFIKNYQDEIIDLYLKDPSELELLKGVTGKTVSAKLYELSLLVDEN